MTEQLSQQEITWGSLYDRICATLEQFGEEDHIGRADYLVVDDNYGSEWLKVEVHRLTMLQPATIAALQALLVDHPRWEIVVSVNVPGTETIWPPMGLVLRASEVVDGLERKYLPEEFRSLRYPRSVPDPGNWRGTR